MFKNPAVRSRQLWAQRSLRNSETEPPVPVPKRAEQRAGALPSRLPIQEPPSGQRTVHGSPTAVPSRTAVGPHRFPGCGGSVSQKRCSHRRWLRPPTPSTGPRVLQGLILRPAAHPKAAEGIKQSTNNAGALRGRSLTLHSSPRAAA